MRIGGPNALGAGLGHASTGRAQCPARGRHLAAAHQQRRDVVAPGRHAPARGPTPHAPTTREADHDHGLAQGTGGSSVAATGADAAGTNVVLTTGRGSTRTMAAVDVAVEEEVETSVGMTRDASRKNGATIAPEVGDLSDRGGEVAAAAGHSGEVSVISAITDEAGAIHDHEALTGHAGQGHTAQKDVTRTEIVIAARVNTRKKDTSTGRTMMASGQMETNLKETPILKKNLPNNHLPKNKSQHDILPQSARLWSYFKSLVRC